MATQSNNTWTDLNNNLEITQFYAVSPSKASSNILFGGSQDNGTENFTGIPTWPKVNGGDGGTTIVDPNNPNRVYLLDDQTLFLSTNAGATFNSSINSGIVTAATTRNFVPPYAIDGAGDVFFGTDEVNLCLNPTASKPTWTQIGIPNVNNFNPNDSAINAIAVDFNDTTNNTVYVSAGSQLFVTKNALAGTVTWTEIDGTVPLNGWPAGFVVGGTAAGNGTGDPNSLTVPLGAALGTAFAVGGSNVVVTTNFGSKWTNITGTGLPNVPIDSIAVLPGLGVFVGTDVGVYSTTSITLTSGATTITGPVTWSRFQAGLPNAQVTDLVAANYPDVGTVLAAATHGRGVWEIQLTAPAMPAPVTAFSTKIPPFESTNGNMGPALGTVNNTTYIAWTGRDNDQLNITPLHANGTPVEPPAFISPSQLTSNSGLSLATLNNQMYVAFTGVNGDHQLLVAPVNINGGSISLGAVVDLNEFSDDAPVLAVFNGNLYIAWTGHSNNFLNVMELNTNGGISGVEPHYVSGATEDGSPARARPPTASSGWPSPASRMTCTFPRSILIVQTALSSMCPRSAHCPRPVPPRPATSVRPWLTSTACCTSVGRLRAIPFLDPIDSTRT